MEHAVAVPAPVADDSSETESRFSNSFLRLKKFLMRKTGEAIVDYGMIEEGDVVMVCVSGGKDSFTLLSLPSALLALILGYNVLMGTGAVTNLLTVVTLIDLSLLLVLLGCALYRRRPAI